MHKEIQNIAENYSSIPWYVLDRILKKLDTEEIKDLAALLEEMHSLAEQLEDKYEQGHSDGYESGYQAGYDACIAEDE